jgi:prepilin-type processing-associated H-X9-DG protein
LICSSNSDIALYCRCAEINGIYSGVCEDNALRGETGLFGSVHPGALNMALCDGSVHTIDYGIEPLVHDHLGNRQDGRAVDNAAFNP